MSEKRVLTDEQKQLVEDIFREHQKQLWEKAYGIVGKKEDADDAVSAAMIRIIHHIEKLEMIPKPQILYFCMSVVKSTSIDLLRRNSRMSFFSLDEEKLSVYEEDPAGIAERNEKKQLVREAQQQLNNEERLILHLRYDRELPFEEIAVIFGVAHETAKKRVQRAVQKLRRTRIIKHL